MLDKNFYSAEPVSSWLQLVACYEDRFRSDDGQKKWIFRGQRAERQQCKPTFVTSLETAAKDLSDQRPISLPDIEKRLLREFKRRLHHYTSDVPREKDTLEWLALMRHHGAPTRLLDWTYSFYVAVFHAVKDACEEGYEVWALNTDHFNARHISTLAHSRGRLADHLDEAVVEYLMRCPTLLVHPANPFRLNERLTIQQGVFLFPGDITKGFEANLTAQHYQGSTKDHLARLGIDRAERKSILDNLYRMNVSRATLFPGLDGFAESLKTRLPLP